MKLRVLGCSGGIGGRHLRTTSLLVDHDLLIDAGTGLGDLHNLTDGFSGKIGHYAEFLCGHAAHGRS